MRCDHGAVRAAESPVIHGCFLEKNYMNPGSTSKRSRIGAGRASMGAAAGAVLSDVEWSCRDDDGEYAVGPR
ncbi:hypothetical protein CHELA1G11_14751 [Hyphomicrobiales bacterium]|nr:hypothetical protein CHELA1G2_14355 [Hyphomicrobiales bacterium]CAH1680667.1 hypothetical protein CHELA1G11_14751 [Hyphomicrobiales bacterium]